jgi:hypothetical protein
MQKSTLLNSKRSIKKKAQEWRQSYNIVILDVIGLAPRAHDEGVVEGNAGNDIDALALQLGQILDEARKMLGGASGGEGARHGEQNHLLISPLYRGICQLKLGLNENRD